MKIELMDIVRFIVAPAVVLGIILGAAYLAIWTRTKIVFSSVGRFLANLGLSRANGTVDDLAKGKRYFIKKSFVDYHGGNFAVGEI